MKREIEEILLLHHSHYDRGYMHPPEVEDALQVDYLRHALDWCDRWPEGKWTAEVTRPVSLFLREAGGDELSRLRSLCASGRFGIGAMQFHPEPLLDAEQLAELAGHASAVRAATGAPVRCAFLHDVNGLPWPAVGALLDQGVEILITAINVHLGNVAVGRHRLFWWKGPDGRRLLVFNAAHYGAFNREFNLMTGTVEAMREGWADYQENLRARGHDTSFAYITATHTQPCDCNPPDEQLPRLVRAWNAEKAGPPIRFVTAEDLLEKLRATVPASDIPEWEGDWTDWWSFGVGSTPMHTAIARRGRRRLRAAQWLRQTPGDHAASWLAPRSENAVAAAVEKLGLWNEHTWGAMESVDAHRTVNVRVQGDQKLALAADGYAWADLALRIEMERLAGNPLQCQGFDGCIVANPSPAPAVIHPWVPADWLKPEAMHNAGWMQHISAKLDYTKPAERHWLLPVELPAQSWRHVAFDSPEAAPGVEAGAGWIQNAWTEMRFDPKTGRILAIVERATGLNRLPKLNAWDWGAPVCERPDPAIYDDSNREMFFETDWKAIHGGLSTWRTDWHAEREQRPALSIGTRVEGGIVWLDRAFETQYGHEVVVRIGLSCLAEEIVVEWDVTLRDQAAPHALYAVFPTGLAEGWRGHFDSAGSRVEYDAGQLPGACRDHACIDELATMEDSGLRIALRSPDTPLVVFGNFSFGRIRQQPVARTADPLLLAWVFNNYWSTNFFAAAPSAFRTRYYVSYGTPGGCQAARWDEDFLIHPQA
jgi:hypothetical protein